MTYGIYLYPIIIKPANGNHYALITQVEPKSWIIARIYNKDNKLLVHFRDYGYGELEVAIDECNEWLEKHVLVVNE